MFGKAEKNDNRIYELMRNFFFHSFDNNFESFFESFSIHYTKFLGISCRTYRKTFEIAVKWMEKSWTRVQTSYYRTSRNFVRIQMGSLQIY